MLLYHKIYGEGEPLIILHGLYGMSDNWTSIAKVLQTHFKVILVDLRNHGKSPKSNQHNYTYMAEDINTLCEHLNIKNTYLIGHSMGGKVAMTFASMHPEKIRKLIIVDISPRSYTNSGFEKERVQHRHILDTLLKMPLKDIKTRQEADEFMAKYLPSKRLRAFLMKSFYRTEDGAFAWRLNLQVINDTLNVIMEGTENLAPNFKEFQFDTLFIKGELSGYVNEPDIEWINKHFTNVEIKTVKQATHWVHADQPEEFIKLVLSFLA